MKKQIEKQLQWGEEIYTIKPGPFEFSQQFRKAYKWSGVPVKERGTPTIIQLGKPRVSWIEQVKRTPKAWWVGERLLSGRGPSFSRSVSVTIPRKAVREPFRFGVEEALKRTVLTAPVRTSAHFSIMGAVSPFTIRALKREQKAIAKQVQRQRTVQVSALKVAKVQRLEQKAMQAQVQRMAYPEWTKQTPISYEPPIYVRKVRRGKKRKRKFKGGWFVREWPVATPEQVRKVLT